MATTSSPDPVVKQIMQVLQEDYARFPHNQTFGIYAPDVRFRDPLNQMSGRQHFQQMIGWMSHWFQELYLDLHEISAEGSLIRTRWTMGWLAPLPWHPRMRVTGWSELVVNADGLIAAQTDYWDCSRWELLQQLWRPLPIPAPTQH